ncbi:MAG: hypothetical protein AAF721_18260 [Myxococcota bacterium]
MTTIVMLVLAAAFLLTILAYLTVDADGYSEIDAAASSSSAARVTGRRWR